jgi:hypothetical protein
MEEQYLTKIKKMLEKHFGYKKEVSLDFTIQSLNLKYSPYLGQHLFKIKKHLVVFYS